MRALAALLVLAVAAQAIKLDFSSGIDGWVHSEDSKYSGRFAVATPEPLNTQALKASGREREGRGTSSAIACRRDPPLALSSRRR